MPELEEIVAAVATSKKYRSICTDTIRRIAERELANRGNVKAAAKATKRRLHQVYGAFEQDFDYEAAYQRLQNAYKLDSDDEIKAACRHVLEQHSSTRERLPILDQFYRDIFEITGQPSFLLDLGCGLNPLALPWMGWVPPQGSGQAPGIRYVPLDIDADRVRFLNRYLELAGLEPLARCQDVLSHSPGDAADVALLLKMSPTLERQELGATLGLIEQLRAPYVVVSFAVKSLGGRKKGMVEHYQQQFLGWLHHRQWPAEKLVFESELVFVVGASPSAVNPAVR
jgi:16S rRNA (guanine(1405)-N(7))-methyltransferase